MDKGSLTDLMKCAMEKAAASFSRLIGKTIKADMIDIEPAARISITGYWKNESLVVLITPLIGAISGKSFLVMTLREAEQLTREVIPDSAGTLRDAFLKELDNILSAAAITEIVNHSGYEVFGDVPELHYLSGSEADEMLSRFGNSSFVTTYASFTWKDQPEFKPRFIWKIAADSFQTIAPHSNTASG